MSDRADLQMTCDGTLTVCRFTGSASTAKLLGLARQAQNFALKNNSSRMLVDIRGALGQLNVASRFIVGSQMALFWNRNVRLAVVCRADQTLKDRFWEIVVNNQAIGAKIFFEEEDPEQTAKAWLQSLPDLDVK